MSTSRKSILMIAAIVVFTAVIVAGVSFAWFYFLRTSMVVVSGDANISINGWYQLVSDTKDIDWSEGENSPATSLDTADGKDSYLTDLEDMPTGQFIAYRFKVTNNDTRDAKLSIRFSNLTDYMFEWLDRYVKEDGDTDAVIETVDGTNITLGDKIAAAAMTNTAKLTFTIDELYYETTSESGSGLMQYDAKDEEGRNIKTTKMHLKDPADTNDMYLWKYSYGQRFIGNYDEDTIPEYNNNEFLDASGNRITPDISKVPLPAKTTRGRDTVLRPVYVYFVMTNKMSTEAIETYRSWLTEETHPGDVTGFELAANRYGYTWSGLTEATSVNAGGKSNTGAELQNYLKDYLEYFYEQEIDSINPEDSDGLSILNLYIDYFEFIGENDSHIAFSADEEDLGGDTPGG